MSLLGASENCSLLPRAIVWSDRQQYLKVAVHGRTPNLQTDIFLENAPQRIEGSRLQRQCTTRENERVITHVQSALSTQRLWLAPRARVLGPWPLPSLAVLACCHPAQARATWKWACSCRGSGGKQRSKSKNPRYRTTLLILWGRRVSLGCWVNKKTYCIKLHGYIHNPKSWWSVDACRWVTSTISTCLVTWLIVPRTKCCIGIVVTSWRPVFPISNL